VTMAMYTAVLERTREIGTLKALGASSGYILDLLFRETLVIALLGSVLGIAMTRGSKWLMMHAAPASLAQETVYSWWPIASGISVVGALLGAILPAWKAVKQEVIQALAYEYEAPDSIRQRSRGLRCSLRAGPFIAFSFLGWFASAN